MKIDVPFGEVADRISILRLKVERLGSPAQRANALRHLALVEAAWAAEPGVPACDDLPQWAELCSVNERLWEVEDALRDAEVRKAFDAAFVEHARSVYRLNDRRAALKRAIDVALGSALVEEKSHGA